MTASRKTDCQLVRDSQAFAALSGPWRDCLRTMSGANPFLTHAWLSAWHGSLGKGADLRVVVLQRRGEIVAAAPLCLRSARYYGVPVKELIWIGSHTSDRMQFLVREESADLATELWRRVQALDEARGLVRLEEVPAPSLTEAAVRAGGGRLGSEPSSVLPWVRVDDWEAFEESLPRKFRSELRTRVKVFDSWGDWNFEVTQGAEVEALLPRLAELEVISAKGAGGIAFLEDPLHCELLSRILVDKGWEATATLLRLEVGDTLIAYLLGFVYGKSFYAYNMAYRPGYEKGSPGKWLFHKAMRWAHEQGLWEFDFLRGANYMKSRWRPSERRNYRLVAFGPGPIGLALHTAVFRVRPWLKRMKGGQLS